MLFSFITFIVLVNIVCFYQCHLISLIENGLKDENIKVYTNFELRTITSQMNRSPRTFVHKPEIVLHVRRLKLHRRRRKSHCGGVGRIQLFSYKQNNQNNNNNIEVVTVAFHDGLSKQHKSYQNVVFGMINIRSIKWKEEILSEVIKDEDLYVLFVTETWLKWIQMDNNHDLHCADRPSVHRGGVLALITKKECKAKFIQGGITRTFEYGLWELTSGRSNIILLGIYHPPPSNRNIHTNENFIDEFLELFMDLSKNYTDLLIMGGFNTHYYHNYDIIGEQFQDSMEALA